MCFQVAGSTSAYVEKKKLHKDFFVSSGSCLKPDKCPQEVSFELERAEAEVLIEVELKSQNEKVNVQLEVARH